MIKSKILNNLELACSTDPFFDTCYSDYDVSEVTLADQRLDSVGFIEKFVNQNN